MRPSHGEAWIRYGVRAGLGACALLALAQRLPLRSAGERGDAFPRKPTSRVVLGLRWSLAPWILAALCFGSAED